MSHSSMLPRSARISQPLRVSPRFSNFDVRKTWAHSRWVLLVAMLCSATMTMESRAERSDREVRQTLVDKLLKNSSFDDSAGRVSEKVLNEPEASHASAGASSQTKGPAGRSLPREMELTVAVSNATRERMELIEKLRSKVDLYLKAWKESGDPEVERCGIDLVFAKHLDLTLLKFIRIKSDTPGNKKFAVVYDNAFRQHVRKRGRQLKLKRMGRFPATVLVFSGIFAALFFVYGTLKVLNSRASKHDDYISAGRISMV